MTTNLSTNEDDSGGEHGASEAPADPKPPLSPLAVTLYSLASVGFGAFFSLNNYILPLFLKKYTSNAVILGLMGSSHSIEGALVQPLIGSASDGLKTRLGRRRPFMLVFIPLASLFMLLTPLAASLSLPAKIKLGLLVLLIFLFTLTFNVAYDPYQSLMPDITPESQRGRVSGIWNLLGNMGQAGFLLLIQLVPAVGDSYNAQLVLVAVLMIVTTLLTCAFTREPKVLEAGPRRLRFLEGVKLGLEGLKTLKQAAKAMAVFGLAGIGIGAVVPNLSLFVKTITHCTDKQATMMAFLLMLSTAIGVSPFGWLADKIGSKTVTMIGFSLIGIAALMALGITNLTQVGAVLFLAGLGNAAQATASYPLLTDLVPGAQVGFYTGFQSTMLSIAQPLSVVITGMLINHANGSYRLIFAVCAVAMLAAMAVLRKVDVEAAGPEIQASEAGQGFGIAGA